MKKIILMTILLSGLFLVGGSSATAQKIKIPPGSYQQSCKDISVNGNILEATCNQSGGSKEWKYVNKFEEFFLCADDIRNDNGSLKCTKSKDAPLMKKAEKALASAYPIYYGEPYGANLGETRFWVIEMIKGGFLDQFYKGLAPIDAAAFIETYIKKPENSNIRLGLINHAYRDVYGFQAQPKDVAFWNAEAKNVGNFYQSVIQTETQKLNTTGSDGKNPSRRIMINSVYKKAMGRNASQTEIAYWEKRPEIFKQIIEASRGWLYSSNGAKDLAETVTRALSEKKGGTTPSKDEINQAIIDYSKKKVIFAEM